MARKIEPEKPDNSWKPDVKNPSLSFQVYSGFPNSDMLTSSRNTYRWTKGSVCCSRRLIPKSIPRTRRRDSTAAGRTGILPLRIRWSRTPCPGRSIRPNRSTRSFRSRYSVARPSSNSGPLDPTRIWWPLKRNGIVFKRTSRLSIGYFADDIVTLMQRVDFVRDRFRLHDLQG